MMLVRRAGLLLFIGGIGIGAITVTVIRDMTEPVPGVATAPSPSLSVVGSDASDMRQAARLAPTWSDPIVVASGPVAGRVTAVTSATRLVTGETVVHIFGREVPALAADAPPWRDLAAGTTGADVADVARLLQQRGLLDVTARSTTVDDAFIRAVRHFERATGREQTGVFKPDYVVWLPREPLDVARILAAPNSSLAPDSPLLIEQPRLISARVVAAGPGEPLVLPAGPLVYEIPGALTVTLSPDGSVTSQDLQMLEPHLVSKTGGSADSVALPEDPQHVFGIVRLQEPRTIQVVASNSILASADGRACIVTESGKIEEVTILSGFGGTTEIEPTLDPSLRVQLDPSPDDHRC